MLNHTTEPWELRKHSTGLRIVSASAIDPESGRSRIIADVYWHEGMPHEELRANAVLLETAPMLLAALKDTANLAIELMTRAEEIDRMLQGTTKLQSTGHELGEIVRLRQQLSRNLTLIEKVDPNG